ncbi:MAG: hypothetical protein JWP25_4718 [Bradyrhizobium sp.]|nr:hypothetical protein [Bradyrhizobium sp.]
MSWYGVGMSWLIINELIVLALLGGGTWEDISE